MKSFIKTVIFMLISAFVICTTVANADAAWPERPIVLVAQNAAGGGTDMNCRMLAKLMGKSLGVKISVVNMPGAYDSRAADYVFNKPANGYTWLAGPNYQKHLRLVGLSERLGWKDWQWYRGVRSRHCYVVRPDSPFKTMGDFIAAARKNPGKIKTASASTGSSWFEGNQIMLATTGIKIKPIPYLKSGRQVPLGLLQGEIDVGNCGLHETIDFIRSGKLRCLAVFDKKPIKLPNGMVLPAIVDSLPELEKYAPHGGGMALAVRRDAPVEVLEKIRDHFVAAIRHPEFRKFMARTYYFDEIYTGEAADWQAAFRETVFDWLSMDLKVKDIKNTPAELGLPRVEDFDAWWPPKGYKPRISSKVRPIQ